MTKKRTTFIQGRITDSEYESLNKLCEKHSITTSEFIRNAIKYLLAENRLETIFNKDKKYKNEILYELHRYGNNLNQIAKDLNTILARNQISISNEIINNAINTIDNIEDNIIEITSIINKRF